MGSYKAAWLMCHKIRTAMVEDVRQFAGIVEVDETLVSHKLSLLCACRWSGYKKVAENGNSRQTIDYRAGQYVVGEVHTNTIEAFWSILKRCVAGIYRTVSHKIFACLCLGVSIPLQQTGRRGHIRGGA
jgi:hypothetical protein